MEKATFAAGCFWGVEEKFSELQGVTSTAVGFMGGSTENPSYQQVCTGNTGHAEVVTLEYDPEKTSYQALLAAFWKMHDPTTLNRQGPDIGTQYRSAIFYHDEKQKREALASLAEEAKRLGKQVVTEIVPVEKFHRAEEYHQHYCKKRGY